MTSPCPEQESLESLLAGALDAATANELDSHLSICRDCQARLDALSDDPVLRDWRTEASAASSPTWLDERPYTELVERLYDGVEPAPRVAADDGQGGPALDRAGRPENLVRGDSYGLV